MLGFVDGFGRAVKSSTVCPIKNAHDKKIHKKIGSEISASPMATLNSVEKERLFNVGPATKRAR